MHINYRYVLHFAELQWGGSSTYTVLDYGCGAGDVIVAGRERGMNFFGSELFYAAGGSTREVVEHKGLLGTLVREIRNGRLDFPDAYFDLVINNQVLEHVPDLDQVLDEIDRVLKPGGKVLSLFPSRDAWREGHCGIPFLHWFSRNSKVRYHYALAFRKLGFGYYIGTKTPEQWAREFLIWIDTYCFYRSRRTILAVFRRHFSVTLVEDDYIQFRLGSSRLRPLARLTQWPVFKPVGKELFRKLGGLVILSTKPHGTS